MTNKEEIDTNLPLEEQLDEVITKVKDNSKVIESIGQEVCEADKTGRLTTAVKKLKAST